MLPSMRFRISAQEDDARAGIKRVRDEAARLKTELRNTGSVADQAGRRISGMGARQGRMRSAVQNTAFQFQDMAVQISGGTDAMRAMSMQLPQLLGGLGVAGAVLGAVVAVGLPLATAMKGVAAEGRDVTEVFGTLAPLAEATARAMRSAAEVAVSFGEMIVNNIDRILTIGATTAIFFAGKWVAGMVAARVATLSLAGAMAALRTALIRLGVGALIVGAGELIFQFTRLSSAAGGFGEATLLVGDVAKEVFAKLRARISLVTTSFQLMVNDIQFAWMTAMGNLAQRWGAFLDRFAAGYNRAASLFGGSTMPTDNEAQAGMDTAGAMGALNDSLVGILGRRSEAEAELKKPYEAIKRIRDLLANMKEENITLGDILGFGGDGDESDGGSGRGSSRKKTGVESMIDAIRTMVAETKKGTSEAFGAWNTYFTDLVSLTGSSNQKLLALAKSFGAARALIDAWEAHNAVLKDPTLPWWARIASAAKVFAAGIGAVSAIKGVTAGGGQSSGAPSSGGAGGASSGPPLRPLEATLNLVGPNAQLFAGAIGPLFDALREEAGDRGYVLGVRATA